MKERLVHTCNLDGRLVEIYERSTVDPTTFVQMVYETFYACDAPDWPKVRIRARRGAGRLLYKLGARPGLQLDDPAFNACFRVDTEDEDFAIALLSLEMQVFLLDKRHVDWSAGHGLVKLFYRGGLKRKRMPRSLDRLRRFWELVPPELLDLAGMTADSRARSEQVYPPIVAASMVDAAVSSALHVRTIRSSL